ncbi:MAG: 23S rRNA (adenine(2503)-C(2))-methyltransferase RlmN [Clostridiales bacterium]|nr:23S rRNA (adenine(2503)-C(2))-methyltransferase RlmN [Clostridiales bacterium]
MVKRMETKTNSKLDLKSLTREELITEVTALGEKPFRAGQMYQWMHQKLARDYDEMTNLPKAFRETLREHGTYTAHTLLERRISKVDGTEKFLFGLSDGNVIESVLMRYQFGNSVCISSQAGCRMGCRFCASTIGGLTRNLLPSEMLDQVYAIQRMTGERVSHVVVMGTGEPLDNYENLLRFLKLLTDENGLHISQRNITVSTCGLTERIRELADEKLQITLALSLHAPSQEKRRELMPVAYKYELGEVLDACRYYFEQTGRRVTFEYSLVDGVNASEEDARRLAGLLGNMNCHINLIPVNPVSERKYVQPDRRRILAFKNVLENCGKTVTIRREMGRDIAGACGQLRKGYMEKGS